jgi:hypothetical protein
VLALAGCTTQPAPISTVTPVSVKETCAEVSDVLTIIANAQSSFRDGRSIAQEYDGAMQLAARIMSRVQVENGTDLAKAIAAGKAVATATPVGRVGPVLNPDSKEWGAAIGTISDACLAAGEQVGISMWTGG